MKKFLKWFRRLILYPIFFLIGSLAIFYTILNLTTEPSHNRDWSTDQAVLPSVEINGSQITVKNVRNFRYASTTSYEVAYYDRTYDLNKIKRAWYIVEPFSGIQGSAHTFVSFEFEDDVFVAVSVEIRKEKGEKYHPVKGLLNKYEIMYVIADEKDVVKLRSNYRKDLVYVYPVKTSKEKVAAMFVEMMEGANRIKNDPEFYNTITNNCTTRIARHVNTVTPKRLPFFSLRFVLPANSDKMAYELGMIDTELSFEDARKEFLINERAMKYADDPDFSRKIRE